MRSVVQSRSVVRLSTRPANPESRGRVVYLTNQLPFPPYSGGQLREAQVISRSKDLFDVHLVVVTPKFERDQLNIDQALAYCRSVAIFEADAPGPGPYDRPERLVTLTNPAVAPYVAELVAAHRIDFAHLEGYFLMQHVPDEVDVPIFLTEENIEYDIDRARQATTDDWPYPPWEVARDLELAAWRRATTVAVVTEEEATAIRAVDPSVDVRYLPSGCDHFAATDEVHEGWDAVVPPGPRVVYTANFGWDPSRDGAMFLVAEVWPEIRRQVPQARLVLAGAGPTDFLAETVGEHDDVYVLGPLASFGPLLHSAAVLVCPLRYGGGVKSKILEGLHAGRPVVTTPVGLQGLPPAALAAIRCGTSAEELARHTVELLTSPDRHAEVCRRVAVAGGSLTTWAQTAHGVQGAWAEMSERSRSA